MAFAFALGKDPFALYGDTKAYAALMEEVGEKLAACKANFRFFFDNKDQLLNAMRSGEVWAAMMWDTGGWRLNRENPDIALHRAAIRRARLARHLRAARARPQ